MHDHMAGSQQQRQRFRRMLHWLQLRVDILGQITAAMVVSTGQLEQDRQACLHDMQEVLSQKAQLQAALTQQQHHAQQLQVRKLA